MHWIDPHIETYPIFMILFQVMKSYVCGNPNVFHFDIWQRCLKVIGTRLFISRRPTAYVWSFTRCDAIKKCSLKFSLLKNATDTPSATGLCPLWGNFFLFWYSVLNNLYHRWDDNLITFTLTINTKCAQNGFWLLGMILNTSSGQWLTTSIYMSIQSVPPKSFMFERKYILKVLHIWLI